MALKILFLGLSSVASLVVAQAVQDRVVDLGYTIHNGKFNETGKYYNFSNVRYAEPPVGDLRFAPPVAVSNNIADSANGDVDRICHQAYTRSSLDIPNFVPKITAAENITFSTLINAPGDAAVDVNPRPQDPRANEDCLFLDVLVPTVEGEDVSSNRSYPVLVWIHGGGFTSGDKNSEGKPTQLLSYGTLNSTDAPIIFVAMNYRLGTFGWLSSPKGNKNRVANAGLFDQRLALEWVQKNIAAFGGDPTRVTVMGQEAGAESVMYHITAFAGFNGSAPFKQAIIQSGGINSARETGNLEEAGFQAVLDAAGKTSLEELRAADIAALTKANTDVIYAKNFTAGPTMDGKIVPAQLRKLLQDKRFDTNVQVMLSYNGKEGTLLTDPTIETDDDYRAAIKAAFPVATQANLDYIADELYKAPSDDAYQGYDTHFTRAAHTFADEHTVCYALWLADAFGNATHVSHYNIYPAFEGADLPATFWNGGTWGFAHGLAYRVNATVAGRRQAYVRNFVTTGDPNGLGQHLPGFSDKSDFAPYGNDSQVLELSRRDIGMMSSPVDEERCAYWKQGEYLVPIRGFGLGTPYP
ncbi:MAG: hypothetical protein M1833_006701 [Piccolia ochrophora]|nr:MAG: hypothetical protein M1833_006701 [Piccolia ochrophora]